MGTFSRQIVMSAASVRSVEEQLLCSSVVAWLALLSWFRSPRVCSPPFSPDVDGWIACQL